MFAPTDFDNWPLDPEWQKMYDENISKAEAVANGISLIHVTGNRVNFAQLVIRLPQHLLVSDENSGRTSRRTLFAEDTLGLGRCLYFYAGRAYPLTGGVAVALEVGCENGHIGSATPFDTGGLANEHICSTLPNLSALIDFCRECMIKLELWRQEFAKYLAAYFLPLVAYWTEGPCKPDPAGIFLNVKNEWRAWVYEVRFHEPHSILDTQAWCASETQWGLYEQEIQDAAPGDVELLEEFLQRSLKAGGTPRYGRVIEEWVRQRVEL